MVDAPTPPPGGKPKVTKSASEGGTYTHQSLKCFVQYFLSIVYNQYKNMVVEEATS